MRTGMIVHRLASPITIIRLRLYRFYVSLSTIFSSEKRKRGHLSSPRVRVKAKSLIDVGRTTAQKHLIGNQKDRSIYLYIKAYFSTVRVLSESLAKTSKEVGRDGSTSKRLLN